MQSGIISGGDSTGGSPAYVSGNGNMFPVTWNHVHEETYEHIRYQTQELKVADWVSETNSYMLWLGDTLYRERIGSTTVSPLDNRPVVDGGLLSGSVSDDDHLVAEQVFNISGGSTVALRFEFQQQLPLLHLRLLRRARRHAAVQHGLECLDREHQQRLLRPHLARRDG